MAFIKSNPIPNKNVYTTKGLYIGKTEAEGENNPGQGLKEYYEDFLNIDHEIASGKFLIVGRKGVGKSAYVKHLCDNSSLENEILCDVVKKNNIALQKIIQSMPNELDGKACHIYEWIILTELVKLLLSNINLRYSEGYEALQKFQEKNSGIINVDKWMPVSVTQSNTFEVNFYPLKKAFPMHFGKNLENSQSKAPFYMIIPSLREIVMKMLAYDANKGINYIVLFDDLDVHFDLTSQEHKTELMDLIRIARDYNTNYFPNQDIKVILMLRDDIAMYLDGISPDKNKIFSSYEYRLQWYESDKVASEEHSKLRNFINKRIEIGLNKLGVDTTNTDSWSKLIDNKISPDYKFKTAFKYILDFTFYRPRDLVAFFNGIGEYNFRLPLNSDDVKKLLVKYIEWNVSEIKDELSNLYSSYQIDDIFSFLREVAFTAGANYEEIKGLLKDFELTDRDFETLLNYNYLIPKDERDRQYFSYREKNLCINLEECSFVLPKCLYCYFRRDKIN